jgi:hypothetical protein
VTVAYVVGFAAFLIIAGWHPHAPHKVGVVASWLVSTA